MPYRLPVFRDPLSGRKVPMRSSSYTVLAVGHGKADEDAVKATSWDTLPEARRSAAALLAGPYDRVLIAKPAGLVDDDDFLEALTPQPGASRA